MADARRSVVIDYQIAKDLVDTKQTIIRERIRGSFNRWDRKSVDQFLDNARTGVLEEAEYDAVV